MKAIDSLLGRGQITCSVVRNVAYRDRKNMRREVHSVRYQIRLSDFLTPGYGQFRIFTDFPQTIFKYQEKIKSDHVGLYFFKLKE